MVKIEDTRENLII